jgi:two-component system OmpR family sensor kinase
MACSASAPVATGLAGLVAGRVEAWSAFAAEHGVAVVADVDRTATVAVTPGHLEQVLDNLLSNAIEVAPEGTAVRIDAAAPSAGVVGVRVSDAGPGMDAVQRARAFDRFWRPAGASAGGSGLGLAIVRGLVEADGGSVELGEADGGGLEVRIRLRAGAPASA